MWTTSVAPAQRNRCLRRRLHLRAGDTGPTLTVESSGRSILGWIEQPGGYPMVDLVATDITDDTMRGSVDGSGCTTFRVGRDRS
ncbi:hypothetical protein [Nocardia carnea]|uniref:hypothetical protein n=1 Tax=Nocardia carnea TaxID=37328 RepID=UPI002453D670|nr:hypothetical protein [Nocardia carnea]